ncbi:MAG: S41 family peptidase [Pseudomonadota bacterium]
MRPALLPLLLLCALAVVPARAGDDSPDDLPSDGLYVSAVRLVRDRYLFPENVTADCLFKGAVDQLTSEVAWLMAETEGNRVALRHGDDPVMATIELGGMEDLPRAMAALEAAVRRAGYPLDPDLQLDVEILKGATACLDRHSSVLAGARLDRFNERISGKLSGIGMRYGLEDGEFVVHEVFLDGPAYRGGLKPEDVLLRIDDVSTAGMGIDDVKERIQGPVDSAVVLLVRRGERELRLKFVRAEVDIPNLEQRVLPSGVGYLSISHFSEQTVENLRRALAELASQGALERGLVLDLRGNTGGSLIQAARSADQFLVDGRLVRTVGRDGAPVASLVREMLADDEGTEPPVPVVVLVDSQTASGSEILAGDLALLERAILVGQRTYGKGTVQKTYNLRPDVRLKLTVAEYLLPGDYSVAFQGLSPDIVTGQVVLDDRGARYDHDEAAQGGVVFVRERPGWRTSGEPEERKDPELTLAERIVLRARGPRRVDTMAAARAVLAEQRAEEEARLAAAYSAAGLDWSAPAAADAALAAVEPEVRVHLETDGPPRAGELCTLRARVDNLGDTPLHQVRVQLWSEDTIWNRVTLPVGALPAHGSGEGRRLVKIGPREAARLDDLSIQVLAAGRPSPSPTHARLAVHPRPQPSLAISGQIVPLPAETGQQGARWQARMSLRNLGKDALRGLLLRFDFPDEPGIELIDTEGVLPSLAPGEEARVDLDLRTLPAFAAPALDLALRVDAEQWGRLLRWDFALPLDGTAVRHEAPELTVSAPESAPAGTPVRLSLVVTDDVLVDHAVVYENGHKLRYLAGGKRRLEGEVTFTPEVGGNGLVVITEDDAGHRARRVVWVLGTVPEGGPVVEEEPALEEGDGDEEEGVERP